MTRRDWIFVTPGRSTSDIIADVADQAGLTVADLCGPRRFKDIVRARHAAMYRLNKERSLSLSRIGQLFGGRDHSTVINAIRNVEADPQSYLIGRT